MRRAAERLATLGAKAVVMKGGHIEGDYVVDLLFHDGKVERFEDRRITAATRTAPAARLPRRSPRASLRTAASWRP